MNLSPGWYIAKGVVPQAATVQGEPARPQLLIGKTSQPLGIWRPGEQFEIVVSLQQSTGTPHLAFPPVGRTVGNVTMTRISRTAAFMRMLPGAPRGMRRMTWSDTWRGIVLAVQGALGGGAHQAMYLVASRYQDALQSHPRSENVGARCNFATRALGGLRAGRWVPQHQLIPAPSTDERGGWEAVGDDPQFVLRYGDSALPLPAGWYHIHLELIAEEGRLVSPMLYPDYGHGVQEHEAIRLPEPDQRNRVDAVVLMKSGVSALRLDPSVRPVKFRLAKSSFKRIGRLGALLRMLDRGRRTDGRRDLAKSLDLFVQFALDAWKHGLSAAASHLHNGSPLGDEHDYARWVLLYDTLRPGDIRALSARVEALERRPLVSILVPVFNTPDRWLRRCLDSVLAQAYPDWELCLADDASTLASVKETLAEYAAKDSRIRVLHRKSNGHISAASNDALEMAKGQFIGLLDHDDELRPHALLEIVEALQSYPEAGLLYSDEDKIDEGGRRFQPNFKPDWNPDLLLSQNYLCHFTVIRTDIVRAAGGFRVGYEGSQDHDLFLRCAERLRPPQIVHVPRVLYHWRAIAGSTALERHAKDYASSAGVRAVGDHLRRVGPPGAKAMELAHGHYRVQWPLPDPPPKVSIIVPTRDRLDLLRTCIETLYERTAYPDFEVLVVDNQSEQRETLDFFAELQAEGRARILPFDAPFNYSAVNNMAARAARGEVLCLLNNDVEFVESGWLRELVSHAVRPGVGAVGPMLYFPDGTIQHAGVILGLGGVANHIYAGQPAGYPGHGGRALVAQSLSAVTGACLVIERRKYASVGGMEERLRVAFNDVDFCLRLKSEGYSNIWTPFAKLVHHESASRGTDDTEEKRSRFCEEVRFMEEKWETLLAADPAYNPNLALSSQLAGLAFPPRQARYVQP